MLVSCVVLVLYLCTLERLKRDHLTIITLLKEKYLYTNLLCVLSLISMTKVSKPVSKKHSLKLRRL